MSDFSVRSDNVDVEQIMRQIRTRIREKRGVDYTEEEIRELANVKLEKFIDPKGVRSGLLEEYRRVSTPEPPAPNFAFGEDTLYETHRGPIRWLRSLFRPLLKLLFNPNPLIQALHIQAELNTRNAERAARREQLDALHYEVIHNLVVELTRTGVEVKSLKMRLESMASRLDFDERRARALEGVVQYRAGAVPPLQPPVAQDQGRRDQGPRDQGRRDQGRRDQGPRDQNRRDQGSRDQGGRSQSGAPQGPPPQSPGPQGVPPQVAGTPALPSQGPRDPGTENNALDADGNERRARRRRRRGRRRPGDRFGGEGGSPAGTSPTGTPSVGPAFGSGDDDGGESGDGDEGSSNTSEPKVGLTGDAPEAERGSSHTPDASTSDVPPEVAAIRRDFSDVSSTPRTTDSPSYGETSPASAAERSNGGYDGAAPKPGGDGGPSEG